MNMEYKKAEIIKEVVYVDVDVCMSCDDDGLCQHYCYCTIVKEGNREEKIVKRRFDKNIIRNFKEQKLWLNEERTNHFDLLGNDSTSN